MTELIDFCTDSSDSKSKYEVKDLITEDSTFKANTIICSLVENRCIVDSIWDKI